MTSRERRAGDGNPPMSGHIIGRPDDDLLDVMLGQGADPEQAFIGVPEQGPDDDDGGGPRGSRRQDSGARPHGGAPEP